MMRHYFDQNTFNDKQYTIKELADRIFGAQNTSSQSSNKPLDRLDDEKTTDEEPKRHKNR